MKTIKDVLDWATQTWGENHVDVHEIVTRISVMNGDLARQARGVSEGQAVDHHEIKKELGNFFLSSLRWARDMGYDPDECIALARNAQERYVAKRHKSS